MKIKTKKQLNLPQLIEWAWDNEIRDTFAELKSEYPAKQGIIIDNGGRLHLVGMDYLSKKNTFTVEVEEEITEDTRLDELVVRYRNDDIYIFPQERINDFKNDSSIVAFYIPNDDLTMTLIWRDGKLVE